MNKYEKDWGHLAGVKPSQAMKKKNKSSVHILKVISDRSRFAAETTRWWKQNIETDIKGAWEKDKKNSW